MKNDKKKEKLLAVRCRDDLYNCFALTCNMLDMDVSSVIRLFMNQFSYSADPKLFLAKLLEFGSSKEVFNYEA